MKRTLAKRWYDLSSQDLPREVGTLRPRDFDALPFGTFWIDRQGIIHEWEPAPQTVNVNRQVKGRSIFSGVAPCFFIRPFHESLFELFLRDGFDETFFFTFRFSGDWRQAQVNAVHDGSSLVRLTIEPIRTIRPHRDASARAGEFQSGTDFTNWSTAAIAS